jgi:pSer/pThr/pTyr-binding forkhead associated (FHA) protein
MPKLVVSREGNLLATRFIDGMRLTIGRATDCDVRLEDVAVSKHHAQIEVLGKDYVLRDLGSANGTSVNGQEVTRHLLQHGDLIRVLGFEMRYVDHKSVAGGDGDRTMVIEGGALAPPQAAGPATAMPARAVDVTYPTGSVRWTAGARTGETVPLARAIATFGDPGGQVVAIFRRPSGFSVAAVEGQPPRVNGKPVPPGWQPLASGDRVNVGGDELVLEIAG